MVWFKYTCVAPSAPHKVGENVILIQRGNSQCNHREYAINWESLQSIARRVYSYTSFAVFSSLCSLSLLQLPPLYFSSVLFSFAKCRLRSPPCAPAPSSVEKAPSSLAIAPRLTNSFLFNHISSSPSIITASPSLPSTPFPFTVFFLSCNSPHAHAAFIIIIPPPTNLLTLSTSAPFPPHYLGSILICRLLPPAFPPLPVSDLPTRC